MSDFDPSDYDTESQPKQDPLFGILYIILGGLVLVGMIGSCIHTSQEAATRNRAIADAQAAAKAEEEAQRKARVEKLEAERYAEAMGLEDADPVVGEWHRKAEYGKFQDARIFRADGTLTMIIYGETANGTWTKAGDRYQIKPGGSDDYAKLVNGILETYDSDGLIAKYDRAR